MFTRFPADHERGVPGGVTATHAGLGGDALAIGEAVTYLIRVIAGFPS